MMQCLPIQYIIGPWPELPTKDPPTVRVMRVKPPFLINKTLSSSTFCTLTATPLTLLSTEINT